MPIIDKTGHRSVKMRLLIAAMYLILSVLGVTMAYPFLITVTSSTSNALDYYRFAPISRSLWSREERFTRLLVPYFPESQRGSMEQFAFFFAGVPGSWTTWKAAGDDQHSINQFAKPYLAMLGDPARRQQVFRAAEDYAAFARQYPIDDSMCAYNERQLAPFFREQYTRAAQQQLGTRGGGHTVDEMALEILRERWGVPISSFYVIKSGREYQIPWDLPNYVPVQDGRAADFKQLRTAYRDGTLLPRSVQASTYYLSPTRPVMLKTAWLRYLGSKEALGLLGLPDGTAMNIDTYNTVFGTGYASLHETPYPVPASAPARLYTVWTSYVQHQYPRRLQEVRPSPEIDRAYRAFVQARFKGNLNRCNALFGSRYTSWETLTYPPRMPEQYTQANLWVEFLGTVPASAKVLHGAEVGYQQYLRERYKTLDALNAAYGWHLQQWEQAEMPIDMAYLATFARNERPLYLSSLVENYQFVLDYLVRRGRAVGNTFILILLTLVAALTVNPLAAYALSRFQMKQLPAIILFMLATMAFPAAVSMIPGFLLMRDLHMLNTYWALILPGIANGMGIFMLKGFFDSLPPELYEAAALDGAPEWQVFSRITLPLSKPILAVIALNCFIGAYNSWEWAVVVCQNPKMWTLAVWLFQFNSQWATQPWAVMASFVVASIPVFLVFLLCQNIILRGIVLPQMK